MVNESAAFPPGRGRVSLHGLHLVFTNAVATRAVLLAACLCVLADTMATEITLHYLTSVQLGPGGEILVTGTMGSMLSVDGGTRWTPPVAPQRGAGTTALFMRASLERISTEHDLRWARVSGPLGSVPAMDTKGRMYACSKDGRHVDISDSNGRDWNTTELLDKSKPGEQSIENGVSMITDINGKVRRLRDDAEIRAAGAGGDRCDEVTMIADTPYVLAQDGLYTSEDRGQHWVGKYHFLGGFIGASPPRGFRLLGDSKGTLYVNHERAWRGGSRLHIFRSGDRGATWKRMSFNLPEKETSGYMALLRIHKDALYFVSQPDGSDTVTLYKSADGESATKLLAVSRGGYFPRTGFEFVDIGAHGEVAVLGLQDLSVSIDTGKTWKVIGRDTLMSTPWVY